MKFMLSPETTVAVCTGRDAFVLRTLCCGKNMSDLGVAMIPGTQVTFFPIVEKTVIKVERTRQIDLVVPRSRARVHFASVADPKRHQRRRHQWAGIAPHLPHFLHREEHSTLPRNMVVTGDGAGRLNAGELSQRGVDGVGREPEGDSVRRNTPAGS